MKKSKLSNTSAGSIGARARTPHDLTHMHKRQTEIYSHSAPTVGIALTESVSVSSEGIDLTEDTAAYASVHRALEELLSCRHSLIRRGYGRMLRPTYELFIFPDSHSARLAGFHPERRVWHNNPESLMICWWPDREITDIAGRLYHRVIVSREAFDRSRDNRSKMSNLTEAIYIVKSRLVQDGIYIEL